ncbi:MAG: glutamate 5-kinase [Clostridia bacterium]|nr:glutamate 5-kinase [Clostridia bacterium]
MLEITKANTIVIKVGTSTLTYPSGKLNLRGMESLCKTISDLQNSGKKIILVSSGAIGVGMGKVGMTERPTENSKKQALAAIGQCELMFMYDKLFGEYDRKVAQVLLTKDVTTDPIRRKNATNTFRELLEMDIIPIVNENDTVATDELEGIKIGDNDTLSAIVAELTGADALVILTDIDGMYDDNPKTNPDARRIPYVREITPEIEALAGGAGSSLGTGGMATKVSAAKIATSAGILTAILSSDRAENLYDLLEGRDIGTIFAVPWKR